MIKIATEVAWYDLFSRGARDWIRHNEKVREAVEQSLPSIVNNPEALSSSGGKVLVPVRMLEHARFRLRDTDNNTGAGQGSGKPGDVLRPGQGQPGQPAEGASGGSGEGEIQFVMELKVDDVVDWLWERMKLPDLKPKPTRASEHEELVRSGWDRRGARSRLDRRRTIKEAVKRRAVQTKPAVFTDDDLRFRQLVRRRQPSVNAAVIFALDVSGSMGEHERRLAKTFFFFALQGLRRQYARVETAFLAHAGEAWEFTEGEFFQAAGTGGTVSSTVLNLTGELLRERYDPGLYNVYLFYASDGENFSYDRDAATAALRQLAGQLNYTGFVEIRPAHTLAMETEMGSIFNRLREEKLPLGSARIARSEDVWDALRAFFAEQAANA